MDTYHKNLEALRKTHPHVVDTIQRTQVDFGKMTVVRSDGGNPEIHCRREDGAEIVIGGSIDLTGLPKKAEEVLVTKDGTGIILLLAFGLGDYPLALLKRMGENGLLVVYEAMPELVKIAMQECDLTELLGSDRFRLILGEGSEDLAFIGTYHRQIATKNIFVFQQASCVALREAAYKDFRDRIAQEKRLADSTVATGVWRGAEWTDAFLENLPTLIRSAGVKHLQVLFKGRPAIIVSAGPSLEKNFHLLKEAKGRAIIIAVDVVVPTLLPAGIIPDFVVAIESNRKLFRAFEGNPMLKFAPLVCGGEVNHETVTSLYPGPVFVSFLPHHPVSYWLHRFWESKGFVKQFGGSVAHIAFALAEMVGSDCIAFVGQDLSFQEKLHAGEVTGLFYSEEDVEKNRRRNPVVKDIFGEERYTMGQFLTFRTSFEKAIKKFQGVVINATEGGLPIDGARNMRLKDFLDRYCDVPPLDTFDVLNALGNQETAYDLPGLLAHTEHAVSKLKTVRRHTQTILDCVSRLKMLKENHLLKGSEAGHLVRTIERLEKKVADPILKVVAPYRYRMENYLRRDNINDDTFDMIQDSLDYYGGLLTVIDKFLAKMGEVTGSLKRELEADRILNDTSTPAIERYLRTGMMRKESGLVREAVKDLERAASEFAGFSDGASQQKYWSSAIRTYSTLSELYLKQYRFYEAEEILEALQGILPEAGHDRREGVPNSALISRLKQHCVDGIHRWKKKEAKMEDLLRKAEANYGSDLESASFYLRIGEYEAAEQAYIRAISDTDRNRTTEEGSGQTVSGIDINRLVSAWYGLTHTYVAMKQTTKAMNALDQTSRYLDEMDKDCRLPFFEDIRRELADLYRQCQEPDRVIAP